MKLIRFTLFLAFFGSFFHSNALIGQNCQYTLVLRDLFGNGWNGNFLTLKLGSASTDYTLTTAQNSGDSVVYAFNVTAGQAAELSYTTDGSFSDENSFTIFDNDGKVVYHQDYEPFPGLETGLYWQGTTACVACVTPKNLEADNVFAFSAKVRWTAPGGSTNHVIYGPAGFNLAGGAGDTATVSGNKATLNGLFENTPYEFYVYRDCGAGAVSAVAGPVRFQTYYSDDVGVVRVVAPVSDCDLGGSEILNIQLKNYGAAPQSLVPFYYSVDGVPASIPYPQDGLYTGVLGKDSAEYIQFETLADLSAPGQHEIKVWTELDGDDDPSNDTLTYYLTNKIALPHEQDFAAWHGGWYVNVDSSANPSWAFGEISKNGGAITARSPKNAWATGLSTTSNADELSYLVSPCFDFSAATTDPILKFSLFYNTNFQGNGGAFLDMSLDNGATWKRVGDATGPIADQWYNYSDFEQGDVWSGTSVADQNTFKNDWVTAKQKLTGAAGKSNVTLRFGFFSGFFGQTEGAAIDDIEIFIQRQKDVAAVGAASQQAECGSPADKIVIRLRNEGTQIQTNIPVGYSINGGPVVAETAGGSLAAGNEKTYTFSATFNSTSGGPFQVLLFSNLNGDQNTFNDTTHVILTAGGQPLPLREDFEASIAFPLGWDSDGGFVTAGHNAPSNVVAENLYEFNTEYDLQSPAFGPLGAADTLRFDYRIVDYDTDPTANGAFGTVLDAETNFNVRISTDCGQTYTTVYTIQKSNHVLSGDLKTVAVPLAAFAGKTIKIRIEGEWFDGDFWFDCDNFNLGGCPANFEPTVVVEADANQQMTLGSATVTPTQGQAPFKYVWSNGSTGQTQTGLAPGTYWLTITDALGCTQAVSVVVEDVFSSTKDLGDFAKIQLAPNPTSGLFELRAEFEKAAEAVQIDVLNLLGQPVFSKKMSQTTLLREAFDLSGAPAGVYFVRLRADGKERTQRVSVQR